MSELMKCVPTKVLLVSMLAAVLAACGGGSSDSSGSDDSANAGQADTSSGSTVADCVMTSVVNDGYDYEVSIDQGASCTITAAVAAESSLAEGSTVSCANGRVNTGGLSGQTLTLSGVRFRCS